MWVIPKQSDSHVEIRQEARKSSINRETKFAESHVKFAGINLA
nr:MAG TPA: hypothetical protein [Caudoviricetes sp.]